MTEPAPQSSTQMFEPSAATQAGNAGATIRDVMARGGWSSERMVLRYLHTSQDRDREIAESLAPVMELPSVAPGDGGSGACTRPVASETVQEKVKNLKCSRKPTLNSEAVRPSGFEPETCGLRVRSIPCHTVSGEVLTLLTRSFVEPLASMPCSWHADIWGDVWDGLAGGDEAATPTVAGQEVGAMRSCAP